MQKNKNEEIVRLLRERNLRITPVRVESVRLFLKYSTPMTIQDLYEKLKLRFKSDVPDWATVYRTIVQFEQSGLVAVMDLGDGVIRYEWVGLSDLSNHHHHLICTGCRSVQHLPICDLSHLDKVAKKYHYQNLSHKLEFFGICPSCIRKK